MQTPSLQISLSPSWFITLAETPSTFKEEFTKKFKKLETKEDLKNLKDLIDIFGYANQQQIGTHLPKSLREEFEKECTSQKKRFFKILNIFLNRFQVRQKLNKIYHLSATSPYTPEEMAISEMVHYLLSLPMPFQEARRLKCNSLKEKKIEQVINTQQVEFRKIIKDLFLSTLPNKKGGLSLKSKKAICSFTHQQQEILFKYAVLKGHQCFISWGYLLFLWSLSLKDTQKDIQPFYSELQSSFFRFDKLLIPPEKSQQLLPLKNSTPVPFRTYVVQQTLHFLFHHDQTLLPPNVVVESDLKTLLEDELKTLFSESSQSGFRQAQQDVVVRFIDLQHYVVVEDDLTTLLEREFKTLFSESPQSRFIQAQQDVVYFIDYLHSLVQPNQNDFPFEKALEGFNQLIPTPVCSFLHTFLHFFHCIMKFSIDKSHVERVFNAIYALTEEERSVYDKWIYENFQRDPFLINEIFISYAIEHKLSLKEMGHIILKFSMTVAKNENIPSPYLSGEQHIKLLKEIEMNFGVHLPTSMIIDFLFFQTVTPKAVELLDAFVEIRSEILNKYLNTLVIPSQFYQSWKDNSADFIHSFVESLESDHQFQPYPLTRKKGYLLRRKKGYLSNVKQLAGLLQLATYPNPKSLFSDFMPSKITQEELTCEKTYQNCLKPILPDFPIGPTRFCRWFFHPETKTACFSVSVLNSLQNLRTACSFQIPLNLSLSKPWIPTFCQLLAHFVDSFANLPNECLHMEGSDSESFDKILHHSSDPDLLKIWDENQNIFNGDIPEVKAELYTFIKTLHVYFKKSFFIALNDNPTRESIIPPDQREKNLKIMYFEDPSNKEEPDAFVLVYQAIEQRQTMLEEMRWEINPLILRIKWNLFPQQTPIQITMEMNPSQNLEPLTVVYDSFSSPEHFLHLMRWQKHLLFCNFDSMDEWD